MDGALRRQASSAASGWHLASVRSSSPKRALSAVNSRRGRPLSKYGGGTGRGGLGSSDGSRPRVSLVGYCRGNQRQSARPDRKRDAMSVPTPSARHSEIRLSRFTEIRRFSRRTALALPSRLAEHWILVRLSHPAARVCMRHGTRSSPCARFSQIAPSAARPGSSAPRPALNKAEPAKPKKATGQQVEGRAGHEDLQLQVSGWRAPHLDVPQGGALLRLGRHQVRQMRLDRDELSVSPGPAHRCGEGSRFPMPSSLIISPEMRYIGECETPSGWIRAAMSSQFQSAVRPRPKVPAAPR